MFPTKEFLQFTFDQSIKIEKSLLGSSTDLQAAMVELGEFHGSLLGVANSGADVPREMLLGVESKKKSMQDCKLVIDGILQRVQKVKGDVKSVLERMSSGGQQGNDVPQTPVPPEGLSKEGNGTVPEKAVKPSESREKAPVKKSRKKVARKKS